MFTLEMLTKQAPASAAEPEEPPAVSLPHVFTPVLAAPALAEEKTSRVRGWVFVAAFVAFIAPVVTVVAVLETTRAPSHPRVVVKTTAAETSASTSTTANETASASATSETTSTPHVHHIRPPRTVTTTTASVKKEAPKCCPGETEMACAMRRSVGATCG